jgi:hypothetical protein
MSGTIRRLRQLIFIPFILLGATFAYRLRTATVRYIFGMDIKLVNK